MRLSYTIVEYSHFSFIYVLGFESGYQLFDQSFYQSIICSDCPDIVTKVDLLVLNSYLKLCALKFEKLCQLMPILNASIILKCLHAPIMLKIMPA